MLEVSFQVISIGIGERMLYMIEDEMYIMDLTSPISPGCSCI